MIASVGTPPVDTLSQAVQQYLYYVPEGTDRHLAEKRRILKTIARDFGDKPVSQLRPIDLLDWISSHPEWVSAWTKKRVGSTILTCLNWCERMGLVSRNPFRGASFQAGEVGRPMTEEEYRQILRNSSAVFRRFVMFLYATGCRPGEAAGMKWPDVDFTKSVVVLKVHKTLKKSRRARLIVLIPPLVRMLAWLRARSRGDGYVFLNHYGGQWGRAAIGYRLGEIKQKAGLRPDLTLYDLRHFFACRCILAGVDLKATSELLGHKTTATTEAVYLHVSGDVGYLQEAAKRAAAPRQAPPPPPPIRRRLRALVSKGGAA
jgi:integrase